MSILTSSRRGASALAALAALATPTLAGTTAGSAWCADRCDQVIIDWNLRTHQVIKTADVYVDSMAAPPALTSEVYATAFNEVKAAGSKAADAKRRTDQTQYAAYWYEFSDIGWNRIARAVARDKPQDLWQRARTFALLNAVMADAYIAGWDSKLHYDFWRPITAIPQADRDANPATAADKKWVPMLPTPPIQDHPSTHSALGAAAAVVLAGAFGSDRVKFAMASPTALPEASTRTFSSFSEAAAENADSRVRAGIHFRFATEAGLKLCEQIGRQALGAQLTPLR